MSRRERQIHTLHIDKKDQGLIQSVPFVVLDNVDSLQVALLETPAPPSVIDLGLRDPHRIRGWSGGSKTTFSVTWQNATPGYLPGPLDPGAWEVLIGLYRIPEGRSTVRLSITQNIIEPGWVAGDFHAHTVHSDGAWTTEELMGHAEAQGLEFLALTDHNTGSQNVHALSHKSPLTIIPGMEWTTYRGHANVWGLHDPLPDWMVASDEDLAEKRDHLLTQGALLSINHPFDTFQPGIAWGWNMAAFPAVEVWNGPWRPTNQQALDWWASELARGRRITAVGGSDVHGPSPLVSLAHPCTWVWRESPGPEGILSGVRQGRVYITDSPQGPKLENGSTLPGTTVEPHAMVTAILGGLDVGDRIRWLTSEGVTSEFVAKSPRLEVTERPESAPWIRLEVHRFHPEWEVWLPRLIANPIYVDPHQGGPHV
ncbi:CehA/McbA family metallohydrolase [Sulfobacillus harzensis]|uniref:PHP domain-containing protein n=1 Tax=Sulfobacillus harzensis TaxID=2729629 RepID=A0A7Y0L735_9FIRM|nr:CehA/McbA family metallohydrolase [Sulfobacillus harzensis]NMP23124.1 PHP domain-containing protein [Sulfobacillus harzensis]